MKRRYMGLGLLALALAGGVAWAELPTLEVKAEAVVVGPEVRLRQVARWSRADAGVFESSADLVVARFPGGGDRTMTLQLDGLREFLASAGLSPAEVAFTGATATTVTRLDWRTATTAAPTEVPAALSELLTPAPRVNTTAVSPTSSAAGAALTEEAPPAVIQVVTPAVASGSSPTTLPAAVGETTQTLRQALVADLADRLNFRPQDLELSFDAKDDKVLRATGPAFSWSITALRTSNLGSVRWAVTIWSGQNSAASRKVVVEGRARAWQDQLVVKKPLAARQQVRDDDVEERRALVDRLPEEMLITRPQAITMQTNRQLLPGTVLTGRLLDPMLLVRSGQVVTVVIRKGAFEITGPARALEAGAYGAVVRVRTEPNNDVIEATVTGPGEVRAGSGDEGRSTVPTVALR